MYLFNLTLFDCMLAPSMTYVLMFIIEMSVVCGIYNSCPVTQEENLLIAFSHAINTCSPS